MQIGTAITEAIGIVGSIANIWGNLLIAQKSERGWVVRLLGNALWIAFGILTLSVANLVNSSLFAVTNVYGMVQWRRIARRLQHSVVVATVETPKK